MENVLTPPLEDAPNAVSPDHVKEVIRQTEQQLRQLMQERNEVTRRIRTVKLTIAGLANIFGDTVTDRDSLQLLGRHRSSRQRGITRACRQVLIDGRRPLTSREVRDQLERNVPALLTSHKDSMATVHTILNRLVKYGEVSLAVDQRGHRAWAWTRSEPDESTSPQSMSPAINR